MFHKPVGKRDAGSVEWSENTAAKIVARPENLMTTLLACIDLNIILDLWPELITTRHVKRSNLKESEEIALCCIVMVGA